MKIITADHVLPISTEPITNGAVAIVGVCNAAVGVREQIAGQCPDAEIIVYGAAWTRPAMMKCPSTV